MCRCTPARGLDHEQLDLHILHDIVRNIVVSGAGRSRIQLALRIRKFSSDALPSHLSEPQWEVVDRKNGPSWSSGLRSGALVRVGGDSGSQRPAVGLRCVLACL